MAYSRIIHTKSEAVGAIPAEGSLSYGEIAINYADGHLYIKGVDNTIKKVASSAFAPQISTLISDVKGITTELEFLNLKFTGAEDLNFGRGNINSTRTNNSLTYGLNNEATSTSEDSSLFGISNTTAGDNNIAIGLNNVTSGDNSIAIGINVTTPDNVVEFGRWVSTTNRNSSIRIANKNVAMTLINSSVSPDDGGVNDGEELDTTLPRGMYAFRRSVLASGESEVLVDVNIDGAVKTCSLGELTSENDTSIGSAIQNNRSDATVVTSIRKMDQATYDNLTSYDDSTLYIVTPTPTP